MPKSYNLKGFVNIEYVITLLSGHKDACLLVDKNVYKEYLKGNIDIILSDNVSDISFIITDNGLGFGVFKDKIKDVLSPYFTTKKKGTGLGLAIVNKTINDHNGSIEFIPIKNGAKIKIKFIK